MLVPGVCTTSFNDMVIILYEYVQVWCLGGVSCSGHISVRWSSELSGLTGVISNHRLSPLCGLDSNT